MSLQRIKRWLSRAAGSIEEEAEGGSPVATPPPGANPEGTDGDRETSTNAQAEGAAGEPWSGNN
jgi:hypothetical protein